MKLNKGKSGVIFLENSRNNKISKKYRDLDLQGFPLLNEYKYLGIWLDNNLNLNKNTTEIVKKIKSKQQLLLTQKHYNNDPAILVQIFKSFILPYGDYGNLIYNTKIADYSRKGIILENLDKI